MKLTSQVNVNEVDFREKTLVGIDEKNEVIIYSTVITQPGFIPEIQKDANEIFNSSFKNGPGCAALVSVKGSTEYIHCAGKGNIALDIPFKLEHTFRIGSKSYLQYETIFLLTLIRNSCHTSVCQN